MKIFILLAVISTCSSGVVPRVFYADEHVSEFETSNNAGVKGNCVNRIRWRDWKLRGGLNSVPLCGTEQRNTIYPGTTKQRETQDPSEKLQNFLETEKVKKTKTLGHKFDKLNWSEGQNLLETKSANQKNHEIPQFLESKVVYVKSPSMSEVTNLKSKKSLDDSLLRMSDRLFPREKSDQINNVVPLTEIFDESEALSEARAIFNLHDMLEDKELPLSPSEATEISDKNSPKLLESEVVYANSESSSEATNLSEDKLSVSVNNVSDMWKEISQRNLREHENKTILTKMLDKNKKLSEAKELDTDSQILNVGLNILRHNTSEMMEENLQETATDLISPEQIMDLDHSTNNTSQMFSNFNFSSPISFQFVTENVSSIEYFSVDENSLMSEGGEIALFQEDSTSGFEFLIDSETAKNMLLQELLELENFAVTDNDELLLAEDEFAAETTEFHLVENKETEANVTDSIGKVKIISGEETFNLTDAKDLSLSESATLDAVSSKSSEDANTAGDNFDIPTKTMGCPTPGFCLFWFRAQDKCTDSSQCQGSSICCKIRCSKTCIDI